jgi:trehalose-6-phosphatase
MIDNLAKDASNFQSLEEQITFQLEVAEIKGKNTILELHAHKQAKGKAWETILENKLPPTLPRSANFRHLSPDITI